MFSENKCVRGFLQIAGEQFVQSILYRLKFCRNSFFIPVKGIDHLVLTFLSLIPLLFLELNENIPRQTWNTPEKTTVRSVFAEYIKRGVTPSVQKCVEMIDIHTSLQTRTAIQLRAWIANQITKAKNIDKSKCVFIIKIKLFVRFLRKTSLEIYFTDKNKRLL